jgi:hypothetical protein
MLEKESFKIWLPLCLALNHRTHNSDLKNSTREETKIINLIYY